jgi:hypothetical protein
MFDQSVQVTADSVSSGAGWRSCGVNVRQINLGSGLFTVTVFCVSSTFAAADTSFFITVLA